MKKILIAAVILIALLALGSWMTPYAKPEIWPSNAQFVGLLDQIDQGPVDIVSVHGMCTHDRAWVDEINEQLADGLELEISRLSGPEIIQGAELWQSTLISEDRQAIVNNFSIVWSPLTVDMKSALCRDTDQATKVCSGEDYSRKRAVVNGTLKSQLMNDCFADAIIYLSPQGAVIRQALRSVIDEIRNRRDALPDAPLFLISESLGSKALADAVLEAAERRDFGAAQRAEGLADLQQIYMGANQMALLELGSSEEGAFPGAAPRAPIPSIERLRQLILTSRHGNELLESSEQIQIIAFTDPNDLLSYELPQRVNGIDVLVSNKPTIAWLFEAPWGAHTGYLQNDAFWQIVACGYGESARC